MARCQFVVQDLADLFLSTNDRPQTILFTDDFYVDNFKKIEHEIFKEVNVYSKLLVYFLNTINVFDTFISNYLLLMLLTENDKSI